MWSSPDQNLGTFIPSGCFLFSLHETLHCFLCSYLCAGDDGNEEFLLIVLTFCGLLVNKNIRGMLVGSSFSLTALMLAGVWPDYKWSPKVQAVQTSKTSMLMFATFNTNIKWKKLPSSDIYNKVNKVKDQMWSVLTVKISRLELSSRLSIWASVDCWHTFNKAQSPPNFNDSDGYR